jgi:MoxR-like ATPase
MLSNETDKPSMQLKKPTAHVSHHELIERLTESVTQAAVIHPHKLHLILAAMLAQGHVLLEDVPGIGKTLVAKAMARSLHASFKRVQCTPDLLPGDITGGAIFNQREGRFEFVQGPIFANVVLVDEINRASPRTQSSLLESMAEGQVTADGYTHKLPQPFFIIATQNPLEMAGTFPLPEAQLDRFLVQLSLGYPSYEDEIGILEREEHDDPLELVEPVLDLDDILTLQHAARSVAVVRPLKEYIVQLVAPDDIKTAAAPVMAHRMMTRDRRQETAVQVVVEVLQTIRVPMD